MFKEKSKFKAKIVALSKSHRVEQGLPVNGHEGQILLGAPENILKLIYSDGSTTL